MLQRKMSLVPDYDSSSESSSDSESDTDSENTETKTEHIKKESTDKLPGPAFGNSTISVFSNPFIEAENAKKAILEKHVKMVPTKQDTKVINGKKICWNYRKGRCRFGHKCAFAHDSDLQKTPEELEEINKVQTTVVCQNNQNNIAVEANSINSTNNQTNALKKKKRPGLTQGLVPGKKVMKMFHNQENNKTKRSSWSTHS